MLTKPPLTAERPGAASAFLAELRAAQDDARLAQLSEYDPVTDTLDEYESASFVINNLAAIRYALDSGMPVTAWAPAQKNEATFEYVLRAVRQFEEQAKLLVLAFVNGLVTLDQMRDQLVRQFRIQARNSFIAGRRGMGDLRPLERADETYFDDLVEPSEEDIGAAMSVDPVAAASAGGGLAGYVAQMVFDPSNYLGSGLPGDPFATLPAPIGAGKPSKSELAKAKALGKAKGFEAVPARPLSPESAMGKFGSAIENYGDSIRSMSHAGELNALSSLPGESSIVWWELGVADHCIDCVRLADGSPYYLSTMSSNGLYPGAGYTRCGGKCHCSLSYDIPSTVCGDGFVDEFDTGLLSLSADVPTPDGSRLNVWLQEAASCSLPMSVDSLQGAEDYSLIDDASAFNWNDDIAKSIGGSVEEDTVSWSDVVEHTLPQVAGKRLNGGFSYLAKNLGPKASDVRLTTYKAAGAEYVAAWRHVDGHIVFDAGTTLLGPTTLDPDFTLRALHDLSVYANERNLGLTVSGDYTSPGLKKWLETIGSPQVTSPGSPATALINWDNLPGPKVTPSMKPGLADAVERVANIPPLQIVTPDAVASFKAVSSIAPAKTGPPLTGRIDHVPGNIKGETGHLVASFFDENGDLVAVLDMSDPKTGYKARIIAVKTREGAEGKGWATRLYDYVQDTSDVNLYPMVAKEVTESGRTFVTKWLEHRQALEAPAVAAIPTPDPKLVAMLTDPAPTALAPKAEWATPAEMIADLEARYEGASFEALAKLDFESTKVLAHQMDEVLTRFGAPPSFKGVETIAQKKGAALASVGKSKSGHGSVITLPESLWGSRSAIEKMAKTQTSETWSTATKVLAANPADVDGYIRAIVTHELGHEYMGLSLFSRFGLKGDPAREAVDVWFKGEQKAGAHGGFLKTFKADRISEYGGKNEHEAWAEMFTVAMGQSPVSDPRADELRGILDKFYPPGKLGTVAPPTPALTYFDEPGKLAFVNDKAVSDKAKDLTYEYKKWFASLPKETQDVFKQYKLDSGGALNTWLRTGETAETAALTKALGFDLAAARDALDTAIKSGHMPDAQVVTVTSRLQKPMTVYRGVRLDTVPNVGDLVTDAAYISTSIDPKQAAAYALAVPDPAAPVVYRIALPKNYPAAWMDAYFGDAYAYEAEMLLGRNSTFRAVARTDAVKIAGEEKLVTVIDLVPEPKALVPQGPPIATAENSFKVGDPQQYLLDPATPPLNAPLAEWSGHVPDEPPMPTAKATAEELADAKTKAEQARITIDDVAVGKESLAISWSVDDTKTAADAGFPVEKFGNMRVIGKNEGSFDPLFDYLAKKGTSEHDDAFWALLGYSPQQLDAMDVYEAMKTNKRLTAGVMVFEPDGRVWVLAPKNKFAGYDNTVIKGGIDPGETAAAAAIRELREETGISAELDAFLGDYESGGTGSGVTRMYVGHRTGGGPLFGSEKETYRVRLLTPDDAKKALTRYGQPTVRDQSILADAVEAVIGKPPVVDYVIPADAAEAFAKATSPAYVAPPAIPTRVERPVDRNAFAYEAVPNNGEPISTVFGYDPHSVDAYTSLGAIDTPPSDKFPIAQTRWPLPGGEKQPMYWKEEAHGGGENHLFWMNSKKQPLTDPTSRLEVHVAQLLRHSDYLVEHPELVALRVNDALLDQVPKLREMLMSAGGIKPSPGTTELTRHQLEVLATAIRSNTPLPSEHAFIPTAPLTPPAVPVAVSKNGASLADIADLSPTAKEMPSGNILIEWHPALGVTATTIIEHVGGDPYVLKISGNLTHLTGAQQSAVMHAQAAAVTLHANNLYAGTHLTTDVIFDFKTILPIADLQAFGKAINATSTDVGWVTGPSGLTKHLAGLHAELSAGGYNADFIGLLDDLPSNTAILPPGLSTATPMSAASGVDIQTAASLKVNQVNVNPDGSTSVIWETDGKSAVFRYFQGPDQITVMQAALDLPTAGAAGRKAMAAAEISRLADLTEVYPKITSVLFQVDALNGLPTSVVDMLTDAGAVFPPHGGVKITSEQIRGLRDALADIFPYEDVPFIGPGPFTEALGYSKDEIVGYTGLHHVKMGDLPVGSTWHTTVGAAVTADYNVDIAVDAFTVTKITAVGLTPQDTTVRELGLTYDLIDKARKAGVGRLIIPESQLTDDVVAALLDVGASRKAGLLVLPESSFDAFQLRTIPTVEPSLVSFELPLPPVFVPDALPTVVPADDLLALVADAAEQPITYKGAAMKASVYDLTGGVIWRRWSNTLEVHSIDGVSSKGIKAHIVRMAQAADAAPKIETLRFTTEAVGSLPQAIHEMILNAGGKEYTGGLRISADDLKSLRDKMLSDASAVAPAPSEPFAAVLLFDDEAKLAKSLTYELEQLKWFDRYHYHPLGKSLLGGEVIVTQRTLAKQLLWARTLGSTDEKLRMAAAVAHSLRMGQDLLTKTAIESVRFENLHQLPKGFLHILKGYGATGTDKVLVMSREDFLKFSKTLAGDIDGVSANAVEAILTPPPGIAPAVTDAEHGLLGMAGHDPATLAQMEGHTGTYKPLWADTAQTTYAVPTGSATVSFEINPNDKAIGWINTSTPIGQPSEGDVQAVFLHQLDAWSLQVMHGDADRLVMMTGAFHGQAGQEMRDYIIGLGAKVENGNVIIDQTLATAIHKHIAFGDALSPLPDTIATAIPPVNAATAGAPLSGQYGYSAKPGAWETLTSEGAWGAQANKAEGILGVGLPSTPKAAGFDAGYEMKWLVSTGPPEKHLIWISTSSDFGSAPTLDASLASLPGWAHGMQVKGMDKLRVTNDVLYGGGMDNTFKDMLLAVGGVENAYGIDLTFSQVEKLAQHVTEDKALRIVPKGSAASFAAVAPPGGSLVDMAGFSGTHPEADLGGLLHTGSLVAPSTGDITDPFVYGYMGEQIAATVVQTSGSIHWTEMAGWGSWQNMVSVGVAQLHLQAEAMVPGMKLTIAGKITKGTLIGEEAGIKLGKIISSFGATLNPSGTWEMTFEQTQAMKAAIDNQLLGIPVTNLPGNVGPGGFVTAQMDDTLTALVESTPTMQSKFYAVAEGGVTSIGMGFTSSGVGFVGSDIFLQTTVAPAQVKAASAAFIHKAVGKAMADDLDLILDGAHIAKHPELLDIAAQSVGPESALTNGGLLIPSSMLEEFDNALMLAGAPVIDSIVIVAPPFNPYAAAAVPTPTVSKLTSEYGYSKTVAANIDAGKKEVVELKYGFTNHIYTPPTGDAVWIKTRTSGKTLTWEGISGNTNLALEAGIKQVGSMAATLASTPSIQTVRVFKLDQMPGSWKNLLLDHGAVATADGKALELTSKQFLELNQWIITDLGGLAVPGIEAVPAPAVFDHTIVGVALVNGSKSFDALYANQLSMAYVGTSLPVNSNYALRAKGHGYMVGVHSEDDTLVWDAVIKPGNLPPLEGALALIAAQREELLPLGGQDMLFTAEALGGTPGLKGFLQSYATDYPGGGLFLSKDSLIKLWSDLEATTKGVFSPSPATAAAGPQIIPLHQKVGLDGATLAKHNVSSDGFSTYYYGPTKYSVKVKSDADQMVSAIIAKQKQKLIWKTTYVTGIPYGLSPEEKAAFGHLVEPASWHVMQTVLKHAVELDVPVWIPSSTMRKLGKTGDAFVQAGAIKKTFAATGETWVLDSKKAEKLLADMLNDPLVPASAVPTPTEFVPAAVAVPEPVAAFVTPPPEGVGGFGYDAFGNPVTPAVATPTAPATISGTYGYDNVVTKASSGTSDIVGDTPHGYVRTTKVFDTIGGGNLGTVRWAEEKFGDAFVLRIRDATGTVIGSSKAMALVHTLADVFPSHFASNPKFSQLLIEKKALEGTKIGEMLSAFGAKEAKTYYRLTAEQVQQLSKELAADSADWVGKAVIPSVSPVSPSAKVVLIGGVPTVASPSFIYSYDAGKVAAMFKDAPTKYSGLINTGETKDILSPLASTGGLAWSVSPSGKAIGVFDVMKGATDAETRDAAFGMLAHVIAEGQQRWTGVAGDKLFFKPDAYDKVPGLRQMLIDAGGKPTQYPKLGEAIELTPDQAAALLNAMTTNTMTGLKVSIGKTSEYLSFDPSGIEKLLIDAPSATAKGFEYKAAGDTVQTIVDIKGGSATFSGLAGGGEVAHVMATVAELNHLAEVGLNEVLIGQGVLGLVPKLDKWLLSVGGEVAGDSIRLDAVSLNNARKLITKDALPVLLGGKALPYSVVDELAANINEVIASVVSGSTITAKGVDSVMTVGVKGIDIGAKVTASPSNLYWSSLEVPGNASVGNIRSATAIHLRSLLNWAAQDASITHLDVDMAVFKNAPNLRAVLLKYGAKEQPGPQHFLSLDRARFTKLRDELEAEMGALTPTTGSYIGQQAATIKWPSADSLTEVPKTLSGQTRKNVLKDADGNEWLFKPGATGRGSVTDKAVAQLAQKLGLPVPPVRIYTVMIDGKPVTGSLQKMLPSAKSIKSLADLSPAQQQEMMKHSILDWVTNNDDAHIGNWLIDENGQLWSIDKSRSWVTFNDGQHDILSTSNNGNGGGVPLIFQFFRDVKSNPQLLNNITPQTFAPVLRALRNMTDAEFRRIIEPVARAQTAGKYAGKAEQMIADMMKRKDSAAADFERYIKGEVDAAIRANPALVPDAWKTWSKVGEFNLDATPRDLWMERLQVLNARFGVYDPHKYTQLSSEGHLSKIRSAISAYFGSGASGHGSGKWGAELIRPRLNPAMEAEWRQLTEWALLNVVNDPLLTVPGGASEAAKLRKWFNPETGKFRLVRSTNRYADAHGSLANPAAYVAGMQKDGIRNMVGTAMGTHVVVGAHGGVFYYLEVDPDQIFSSWALGYGAGGTESEWLVADPRPDQVLHIRPQGNRLDLEAWLAWKGGPLYN